jgi:hypothetical protein
MASRDVGSAFQCHKNFAEEAVDIETSRAFAARSSGDAVGIALWNVAPRVV